MEDNSVPTTDAIQLCGNTDAVNNTRSGNRHRYNREQDVIDMIKAAFPGSYLVDKMDQPLPGEIRVQRKTSANKKRRFRGSKLIHPEQQGLL